MAASALLSALFVLAAPPAARFLIVRTAPSAADAIIVLSGSRVYEERVRHAASLYHQRRARAIVLTDDGQRGPWSTRHQGNPRFIERSRDALLASGVRDQDLVLLPEPVHSTYDEAVAARAFARSRGLRRLLIVTSPYHSRRALWTFTRVFGRDGVSVGIDAAPVGQQSPAPGMWWITKRGWQSVAAEYPKILYYLIAYR